MKVGDMVGYTNGDGPTGLVLTSWLETQPGIGIEESWHEVLWDDGMIAEHVESKLEKINASRWTCWSRFMVGDIVRIKQATRSSGAWPESECEIGVIVAMAKRLFIPAAKVMVLGEVAEFDLEELEWANGSG